MSVTEAPPAPAAETSDPTPEEVEASTETPVEVPERIANARPEELALPRIDGRDIDRMEITFSGTIRLDRSDPADVALFRRAQLGKEIDVRVVGIAAGKHVTVSWDEDGYPGETTSSAKVKLTTVFRPITEDGAMARVGSEQTELVDE